MIPVNKNVGKDPDIKRLSVKDHINGVITNRDVGRTGIRGLVSTNNTILTQDGVVRPRPSTVAYGPQPTGKIIGELFEYKKVTGLTTENWMICMQSFQVSRSPSASASPSASRSPSASISQSSSPSASSSASSSPSSSASPSSSVSPSVSPSASTSISPSSSRSPSSSISPSASLSVSPSISPSSSASPSRSPSASVSVSASVSPSASASRSQSPSASVSPSASISPSSSASASRSPSASVSPSASSSPSASASPSSSISASPSAPPAGAYGQIFIARGEDTSWTAVTGKYFSGTARAHFFQIANKVVIMNGVDNLSYFNIASTAVIPFTTLTNATAPTLGTNNVGGTGFNITYRITANSTVGQTAASNALTVPVDTDRELWNPPSNGGTDNIIINWSAVSGAVSYNVYMGTVAGFEFLIARGVNGVTFTDDGSFAQDTTQLYPTVNTTAGPRASRGTNINGRAFMCGDPDHPYYVWNGGDPGNELDFSPANGGGFSLVGDGSKDIPVNIKSFRDGKGTPQITVLCKGTNGLGKRYILTPDQLTFGSTILTFYDVNEDSNGDGTEAPDGVIAYGTDLHYPSRDGFKTTGTLPQIQNVLSTKRTSNTVQDKLANLNLAAMDGCVGLASEGRLYWALPVNSSSNNEIWVLDIDRKGAWMEPWNIAADWMLLYNDNTGSSHHLILQNNRIYALTYSALSSDNGVAFNTSGKSGQIYFSDDKRMWVQLLAVIFVILSPQGSMNFQVTGKTEDDPLIGLGEPVTYTSTSTTEPAGWSEVNTKYPSWGQNPWSGVNLVPTTVTNPTQEIIYEVDEEIQWADYAWNTSTAGSDYGISDIIFEYVETGIKDLQ